MVSKKSCVLIVDDSLEHQELLRIVLEGEGYCVHSALNGQEALDQLLTLEHLPDLILLDLMMPVMDGYAFRIRQLQTAGLADIPVVVMSASAFVEEQTRRLNALGFIKKPVDINELLRIVYAVFHGSTYVQLESHREQAAHRL